MTMLVIMKLMIIVLYWPIIKDKVHDNVDDYDGGDDNHLVNVLKDQVEDHLPVHPLTVADVKKPLKNIIIMTIIILMSWSSSSAVRGRWQASFKPVKIIIIIFVTINIVTLIIIMVSTIINIKIIMILINIIISSKRL